MMKSANARAFFAVRILLLMICCALLMPAHAPAGEKQKNELESFRIASLTLAVSGISNPVSQLKTFSDTEGTSLRSPGKRQSNSFSDPDDADSPAVLPSVPPLPEFFLCAEECFAARTFPPESHGLIHWYSLAPPASQDA
ncbi:hypothetical protein [Mailhella massiliensis]|uniref:Uncharacterized protein n=1 Tax=Mailhella massiliensis TaxID=1903261 RepID=A0A921DQR6_9BACT|nr:hypothetical protein [Mailhella massiliensis]HJD96123.1 hypothetical protein [Mailhella massiliensis]